MKGIKTIIHFWNNNKKKFTDLQITWNIIPWNALLFEKTLKQLSILDIEIYEFIWNTCHDTEKHAKTRVGFPVIFSRLRRPIEPKFLQGFYLI